MTVRPTRMTAAELSARRTKQLYYGWAEKYANGQNSPRVNGVLRLTMNSYTFKQWRLSSSGAVPYRSWQPGNYRHALGFGSTTYPESGTVYLSGNISVGGMNGCAISSDPVIPPVDVFNDMKQQIQRKITEKSISLLVTLKEIPQSLRMMAKALDKLAKVHDAARRRDFNGMCDALEIARNRKVRKATKRKWKRDHERRPGPKDAIKGVSNYYLEGLFGWNAAYQDIISISEYMSGIINRLPRERARVQRKEQRVLAPLKTGQYDGDFFRLDSAGLTVVDRWQLSCTFDVSWRTVITAAGLDLSGVWQAIPLSFVIDWFANLTSFIKQFNLLGSLGNLSACLTSSRSVFGGYAGLYRYAYLHNGYEQYGNQSANGKVQSFSMLRTTPVSLYMYYPPLNIPTSFSKAVTGAALAAQRFL